MGLEEVLRAIEEEGRAESQAIVDEARKERERILAEAEAEGRQLVDARRAGAEEEAKRREVQELARAELEAKKIVLAAQKEVLDRVREATLQRLASLPDVDDVLRGLLRQEEEAWRAGRVHCAAKDADRVRALVGDRFAGTIDCVGGIVIESEDGASRIDLRFETILDDVWTERVGEVAKVLWPDNRS